MIGLLRPYRGRVALMFVGAAGRHRRRPRSPLPRRAGDRRRDRQTGDISALDLIVVAFLVVAAALRRSPPTPQTYLVGWVGTRALQDLRERVFAHLQAMSIGFFTRRSPGVLISRMTNDIEALNQLVTDGVVTMFSSVLTLVGVVVILLLLDVQLALVTFLTFPLIAARQHRLPDRLPRRLPRNAGADRGDHRLPAGDPQRRAGGAQLRPGAAPRGGDDRAQRGQPRGQHEDRLPQRLLLPGGRTAGRGRHRGDPRSTAAARRSTARSRSA